MKKSKKPVPCGFCGGKPHVVQVGDVGYYVVCHSCEFMEVKTKLMDDKDDAIDIWNKYMGH